VEQNKPQGAKEELPDNSEDTDSYRTDYSNRFPLVSGNCVVINAANKYPAAHK